MKGMWLEKDWAAVSAGVLLQKSDPTDQTSVTYPKDLHLYKTISFYFVTFQPHNIHDKDITCSNLFEHFADYKMSMSNRYFWPALFKLLLFP